MGLHFGQLMGHVMARRSKVPPKVPHLPYQNAMGYKPQVALITGGFRRIPDVRHEAEAGQSSKAALFYD